MTGRQHERHGCVAERYLLIVGRRNVALGFAVWILVDGFLNRIPIGAAHDDSGAKTLLHQLGAADMVAVGMGDDDVFHRGRIEPEFPQGAHDRLLGGIVVERIDQDDALAARQRPGRMDFRADEIEIIEYLRGLGEPGGAVGRRRRTHVRARGRLRRNADTGERAGEIEPRRRLGRRQVGVDGVRLLCERARDAKPRCDRKRRTDQVFHGVLPCLVRCRHILGSWWFSISGLRRQGPDRTGSPLTTDDRPPMTTTSTLFQTPAEGKMAVRAGREFLAIPGPTTLPDEVLRAMHRPAVDIYGGPLLALTDSLLADLSRLFRTEGRSYIYIANGHGAWEAALTNVLSRGDKVLVLESGRFAIGWGEAAQILGCEVETLAGDFRRAVRPEAVAARLKADGKGAIKAILVTQVDTASGVVNDIEGIGKAIKAAGHDALLMV